MATIAANHDKITASCIEENIIVFGTEIGMIYLLSLAGQEITHMRAHHSTITDIDVDNTGNIIARYYLLLFILFYPCQAVRTTAKWLSTSQISTQRRSIRSILTDKHFMPFVWTMTKPINEINLI